MSKLVKAEHDVENESVSDALAVTNELCLFVVIPEIEGLPASLCRLEKGHTGRHMSAFAIALRDRLANAQPFWQKIPLKPLDNGYEVKFPADIVPPRSSLTFVVNPRVYFRGESIRNDNETGFLITQLLVGRRLQRLGLGDGLGTIFMPMPGFVMDFPQKIDTCQPALAISVVVENVTDEPRECGFTLIGKAVV